MDNPECPYIGTFTVHVCLIWNNAVLQKSQQQMKLYKLNELYHEYFLNNISPMIYDISYIKRIL